MIRASNEGMSGRLQGKVALISGSAQGMGAATARRFVEEGARVLLTDVRDDMGEALAREIGEGAAYHHLDVTSEEEWAAAVAGADERFGGVDILVNDAAILLLAAFD